MGSTLIFSYISWLGPFMVQNFEFQIFGNLKKQQQYLLLFFFGGGGREGHKDFVDIFGVM